MVVIIKKHLLLPVSPLDHMMRDPRDDNTACPWHSKSF